jgi:hypothetical protein
MIEDTAHRYYYRPDVGAEMTFVVKSRAIHLTPCPACPDWPAGALKDLDEDGRR